MIRKKPVWSLVQLREINVNAILVGENTWKYYPTSLLDGSFFIVFILFYFSGSLLYLRNTLISLSLVIHIYYYLKTCQVKPVVQRNPCFSEWRAYRGRDKNEISRQKVSVKGDQSPRVHVRGEKQISPPILLITNKKIGSSQRYKPKKSHVWCQLSVLGKMWRQRKNTQSWQ